MSELNELLDVIKNKFRLKEEEIKSISKKLYDKEGELSVVKLTLTKRDNELNELQKKMNKLNELFKGVN